MRKILFCCLIIFSSSCSLNDEGRIIAKSYFDLDSYFKLEANRLTKSNLQIYKTVVVNGESEEKKIKINNWEKEFETFISSDINKSSWRGSFKVKKDYSTEIYVTDNEKIPIKKVEIFYRNDKISGIKIIINTSNRLYISKDTLSYYPDSLYQIKKVQKIKLMDQKTYQIIGKFK